MSKPIDYGKCYWAIQVSDEETVMVWADRVRLDAGCLVLESRGQDPTDEWDARYVLSPGNWLRVYAASGIDGSPVAVDG